MSPRTALRHGVVSHARLAMSTWATFILAEKVGHKSATVVRTETSGPSEPRGWFRRRSRTIGLFVRGRLCNRDACCTREKLMRRVLTSGVLVVLAVLATGSAAQGASVCVPIE